MDRTDYRAPARPADGRPPGATRDAGFPPYAAPYAAPAAQRRARGGWRSVVVAALVAGVVSAAVTAGLVGWLTELPQNQETPAEQAADTNGGQAAPVADIGSGQVTDVVAVSEAVSPSVVNIDVANAQGQGSGSGVIIRADGHILTNNHVIDGAAQVEVTLPNGAQLEGKVIGTDPSSDLAVIKVDSDTDLPVPSFAERAPRTGEVAIAVGSPFGLEGTVTAGVVSALNRSLPGEQAPLVDMIQTDAAINPGNSGGALANGNGEIIGINTAILSPTGSNDGIGFAIPIVTALPVATQLIEQGFVDHAQLGVQGQDVDPAVAELYGLAAEEGALIVSVVPDSAAGEAGMERGDIVTAIDGEAVDSMATLAGRIRAHEPGDSVEITIVRGDDEQTLTVTLGGAPTEQG